MKKQIGTIEAVPSKRLFLSIISDYDLNKSICELIDNTIDVWFKYGKIGKLNLEIILNKDQQVIMVIDNAGGVHSTELINIIAPGKTGNNENDETIGIFGVGTKRAVVALAQDVRIITRHQKDKTYEINFDESWLENEDWNLPYYEVDQIPEGTTNIELKKLRYVITEEAETRLKKYLSATYANFIDNFGISISVNQEKLSSIRFEKWAFPPGFEPRRYIGTIFASKGEKIKVEVLAGLSQESAPAAGEYGVYFYCNDRLIVKSLKNYYVGFSNGAAGIPHFNISLTRVIVNLKGKAKLMPWNSSKSGINFNNEIFLSLREWLVSVVKDYASLCRRWQGDWDEKVFKYKKGIITTVDVENFPNAKTSFLPPLPKSKISYDEKLSKLNQDLFEKKPWVKGSYESFSASNLVVRQNWEQKNRIALILLDSTLEIAFKEYLVNESGKWYSNEDLLALFKSREKVHAEIKKYINISTDDWKKIKYYYDLRCKFIHERAIVGISDKQIENFSKLVEEILIKLFPIKFE